MGSSWRSIHSTCLPSQSYASAIQRVLLALLAVVLLLCPVASRANVYNITFSNVTFTAMCNGGGATCSEVINGSGLYDPVTDTAWNLSIQMTGTLIASFDAYGVPLCTAPGCLSGGGVTGSRVLYDVNTVPGYNPIEFVPNLGNQFDVPTPQPLLGGPNGTLLFVPNHCGGYQQACNTPGTFPGDGTIDYLLSSGTFTSVDATTPEPGSLTLLATGAGMLGLLTRHRRNRLFV